MRISRKSLVRSMRCFCQRPETPSMFSSLLSKAETLRRSAMICFISLRYWVLVICGGYGMILWIVGWGGQGWWSVATVFNLIGRSPRFPEGITDLLFLIQIQFGVVVAEFDQDLQNQVIHGGHIHFGDGIVGFLGFFVGHCGAVGW